MTDLSTADLRCAGLLERLDAAIRAGDHTRADVLHDELAIELDHMEEVIALARRVDEIIEIGAR